MKPILHAFHGFLGHSSDWDLFTDHLPAHIVAPSIYAHGVPSKAFGLTDWAAAYNQRLCATAACSAWAMGYSLGARLAMHLLIDNPTLWKGAILISGHPGYKTPEERKERLLRDAQWAQRFQAEAWPSLMEAWNQQPAFKGSSPSLQRQEKDYSREVLANTLLNWSTGHQQNLAGPLAQLSLPILWINGERDIAYCTQAHRVQLAHPQSRLWIASHAGHRVPWESPLPFLSQVATFVKPNSCVK